MAAKQSTGSLAPVEADERLLVEAAQQDPRRFGELYEHHFERVYAYVARRVRTREEAEDVTSEVFQRALAGLPRFEWRGAPFAAWLFKIASNSLADRAKRTAKEREFYGLDDPPGADPQAPAAGHQEVERRAQLYRLVGELPADQRRVIVARFVEQKSIREIAQGLGRTEGAVKQLQFRGLGNLRSRIGQTHG
ncbi:MAG TPA: sigma-70 family RNA polymerase sigma factor [Terriglobia bacterium]|nr:sigma-70 family RNA polymerase sigma factor [Terriglobia bacterium]